MGSVNRLFGTLYYLTSGLDVEDHELSMLDAPAAAAGNRLGNFNSTRR